MNDEAEKTYRWVGSRPVRPDGVDKVTGAARFAADFSLPGQLVGRILRSPHAHARILGIDTSKAEALAGVKAVVTAADFPELPFAYVGPNRLEANFAHISRNVMAREKALYEGHTVAAVAATSARVAARALKLIKVDYEVLPHVIDVVEAMQPGAPLLHEDMITRGLEPAPDTPSNVAKYAEFGVGDVERGFAQADQIVEMEFTTQPVHQGYIEPHACLARYDQQGHGEIWCSSQGHFTVRAMTAKLVGMKQADLTVTEAEVGGAFGGKTVVYVEPVALVLARKSGRPVKLAMNRQEVFKASGPTSGSAMKVKLGASADGTITAAEASFMYQAGAFPGSPMVNACMVAFTRYDLANTRSRGYDVVVNRPKAAAYRAPGSPVATYAVESTLDELARKLGIDPLELRLKNAARNGSTTVFDLTFKNIGYAETVEALMTHPHYRAPLAENQGRGVASGYWFNAGGESSATMHVNDDGTVVVATGSPDLSGSRASLAMMAAETLGIDYHDVRISVADTANVGFTFLSGGSRVTLATGLAVINTANEVIAELCRRAALMWNVDPEGVTWEDGEARPAGSNVGDFEPLSLAQIAAAKATTGGPIGGRASVNADCSGPGVATVMCDVEVDPETGKVTVLRATAAQDVGRAVHPGYVEGQIQGGVVQGIGWALNEEYLYDAEGHLENPSFLDYRMPVASDLPMIEAVLVEVTNPLHPYGVKGAGEANIVPTLAAVANAVRDATGVRLRALPMSPPRILAALEAAAEG
ncbi:MAG: xanthine dehydrogenase family protein molybdopterin-binding subunit [Alphaproteobacteria bacterium]|jgi:CO/xanthine dehydrogenase Mo-binding subunit|nr:xanthine dehydrogenase family protein molybdopterin-binding subunit [Alphaproteobacteria bacterium]MDP7427938.1 xanthine dehydrogenase family protein molybdopterin-binding subunit [Alphaproteobacteria bacterium]